MTGNSKSLRFLRKSAPEQPNFVAALQRGCYPAPMTTSAADLTFLQSQPQIPYRNVKSKAALETKELIVPFCFRSSFQRLP